MRMIPPVIDVNAPSGEKEIFQLLKDTNSKKFKDCLVFHSLNYPQGTEKNKKQSYEFFGESDFVILVPSRGLINIEVKGGKISRRMEYGTQIIDLENIKLKIHLNKQLTHYLK